MDRPLRTNTERWQYMDRDARVQSIIDALRQHLNSDRVVIYTFNSKQIGQVTFESLSDRQFSILRTSGAEDCFNGEYTRLYEDGRIRAMVDIELEPIQPCHQEFLRGLNVKSNLIVPILLDRKLAGLLVAHHCQSICNWSSDDIQAMQTAANDLVPMTDL
jgi:GAF domain-containing protein